MTDLFQPSDGNYRAPEGGDAQYAMLGAHLGDRRDGRVYVHDTRIIQAVQTAQATGRPLLLRGPAGSGKSSLAPYVARCLKRRYYGFTVTARTQARDLMWSFDALRRLNDAQTAGVLPENERKETIRRVRQLASYIEPQALWWAFDAKSAGRHGLEDGEDLRVRPTDDPGVGPSGAPAVVLVDEIDKADPDVPNNLLECLGSLQFQVEETGSVVRVEEREDAPLVLITTNDERELPAAFVRRCAVLHLKRAQTAEELEQIASTHFVPEEIMGPDGQPVEGSTKLTCFRAVARRFEQLFAEAEEEGVRPPSTAEYLDAVRACLRLGALPDAPDDKGRELWNVVESVTLTKRADEPEDDSEDDEG